MFYDNDDMTKDNIDTCLESEWVKDSTQTLDSGTYNVYQGTGESSLVKLLINEDIVVDL